LDVKFKDGLKTKLGRGRKSYPSSPREVKAQRRKAHTTIYKFLHVKRESESSMFRGGHEELRKGGFCFEKKAAKARVYGGRALLDYRGRGGGITKEPKGGDLGKGMHDKMAV